jgi:hypothetical protein
MKLPWQMRQQLPVVLVASLGGFFTDLKKRAGEWYKVQKLSSFSKTNSPKPV